MALYREIVAPAAEVLYQMSRRGMPLDESRRGVLRARIEARVSALEASVSAAAHDFHLRRRGKIEVGIGKVKDEMQQFLATLPACRFHPGYRGIAKPGKRLCEECRTLYSLRPAERVKVSAFRSRILKGMGLLSRLGQEFKPGSADHWRAWLFSIEGLGLRPLEFTAKTEAPSVKDDAIEALFKRNPDKPILRDRVTLAHLKHALAVPLAVKAAPDGRVHFAYALHRTANGQTSSGHDAFDDDKVVGSEGNIQNVTETYRQIFAAAPGWRLLHVDYAQIEARIMAWIARERAMMLAFLRGEDIHALNAAAIYGCAPEQARKFKVRFEGSSVSARYACKRATHGWDYLMGDAKTARLYGLTVAEARRARMAYFKRWPGIPIYHERVVGMVNADRALVNVFGRRLRFWAFDYRDGHWQTANPEEAAAFPIASAAKDLAKKVMRPLDAEALRFGAQMITHTHDSFTFECPTPRVEKLALALRPILEQPFIEFGCWPEMSPTTFFCPADFSIGQNWADAHTHDADCDRECDRENPDGLVKLNMEAMAA